MNPERYSPKYRALIPSMEAEYKALEKMTFESLNEFEYLMECERNRFGAAWDIFIEGKSNE